MSRRWKRRSGRWFAWAVGRGEKGSDRAPLHRSSLRRVQRAGLASEMDARHGGDGEANPRQPVTYDDFDDEIASFFDEHHRSSAKAVRNKAAAVAARSAARLRRSGGGRAGGDRTYTVEADEEYDVLCKSRAAACRYCNATRI